MGKSKKKIAEVTQAFTSAMAEKYPHVCQDVYLEERDGYHSWVRVRVPPELRPLHSEILNTSVELTDQLWDTGVWIMGLVVQEREPVHG